MRKHEKSHLHFCHKLQKLQESESWQVVEIFSIENKMPETFHSRPATKMPAALFKLEAFVEICW